MQITRVSPGHYNVVVNGKNYDVDKFPDGAWLVFEVQDVSREYVNDFGTKRAAIKFLSET